jgi:putative endonuclease
MYFLYILKSLKDLGYYIGVTDNIERRLVEHNKGKTKSIKSRIPFECVYKESFGTMTEARRRENQLKKNYQIRKFLLNSLGFTLK